MSQPRGFGLNGKSLYTNICLPQEVNCNFVVDSQNGNGLGIRSLKSNGYVANVFMNTSAAPAGSPAMGAARAFAILGASAVTNTGNSVLTGNLGVSPGVAITGFPPGTFSGTEHITDVLAAQAQAAALVSYNDLHSRASSVIATELGGQSLTAGVYSSAGGTFTGTGGLTLTLTGTATDIFVFQTATTLTTGVGAGGNFVITLAGGALASNVYWAVGSSATINSAASSAGSVFKGNVIAQSSITATQVGTIDGSLIALTGAVTLSAANAVLAQPFAGAPLGGNPNPLPGYAWIQLNNNFNKYIGGFSGFVSPLNGVSVTSVVLGQAYVIVSLGTTTLAQWQSAGLPPGLVPAVGQSFIAKASQALGGSGAVQAPSVSGINSLEVIGDPNLSISNSNIAKNNGAWLLVQFLSNGVLQAPKDGSVCGMQMIFDGSSVTIDGL